MTTTTLPCNRSGKGFLVFLLIVAAIYLFAVAAPNLNHADQKHGAEAQLVRSCRESNGTLQTWQKPDGRLIDVCSVQDKFGIYIYMLDENGDVHEITAFIKNKFNSLDQVFRYLKNCGARPLH